MDPYGFVKTWLAAWNAHDSDVSSGHVVAARSARGLDAILSHYTDDVEHASPTVVRLVGEPSGIVRGKVSLREYFQKALAAAGPGLRFEATRTYVGAHGVTLLYNRSGGKLVAETFHFDEEGLVDWAFVAHADA